MCTEMFKALEIVVQLLNQWFDEQVLQNDKDYYNLLQDCLKKKSTDANEEFCSKNAAVLQMLEMFNSLDKQMDVVKDLAGKPVSVDDDLFVFEIAQ